MACVYVARLASLIFFALGASSGHPFPSRSFGFGAVGLEEAVYVGTGCATLASCRTLRPLSHLSCVSCRPRLALGLMCKVGDSNTVDFVDEGEVQAEGQTIPAALGLAHAGTHHEDT